MSLPVWITLQKREGDEYKHFRREFRLPQGSRLVVNGRETPLSDPARRG